MKEALCEEGLVGEQACAGAVGRHSDWPRIFAELKSSRTSPLPQPALRYRNGFGGGVAPVDGGRIGSAKLGCSPVRVLRKAVTLPTSSALS